MDDVENRNNRDVEQKKVNALIQSRCGPDVVYSSDIIILCLSVNKHGMSLSTHLPVCLSSLSLST